MTNEQQRQKLDLEFLEKTLNKAGYATNLQQGEASQPITILSAQPPDQQQVLQLIYIPSADFLEESNLLQLYTVLSKPAEAVEGREIMPLLSQVNTMTTLGYFSVDKEGHVFYRYVYVMPRFEVPKENSFTEIVQLFMLTFDHYQSIISDYWKGNIALEAAIAKLNS